jgi:dGTPase
VNPNVRLDSPLRRRAIRRLIGLEITDAIATTHANLSTIDAKSPADIRAAGHNAAAFSPDTLALNRELKVYLLNSFYRHPRLMRMSGKANRLVSALFNSYLEDPLQLPQEIQERISLGNDSPQRIICDYIAGMTDRFAISEYKKLFDPEANV